MVAVPPHPAPGFWPFLVLLVALVLVAVRCAPPRLVYHTPAKQPAYLSYPLARPCKAPAKR